MRKIIDDAKNHPQIDEITGVDLDEYMKKCMASKKFLSDYMTPLFGINAKYLAELINLEKMPRVHFWLRYVVVSMYEHFKAIKKPKHGDNVDMQHAAYATDVDFFVTSDLPFLDSLKKTKVEVPIFFSGNEFIQYVKTEWS